MLTRILCVSRLVIKKIRGKCSGLLNYMTLKCVSHIQTITTLQPYPEIPLFWKCYFSNRQHRVAVSGRLHGVKSNKINALDRWLKFLKFAEKSWINSHLINGIYPCNVCGHRVSWHPKFAMHVFFIIFINMCIISVNSFL